MDINLYYTVDSFFFIERGVIMHYRIKYTLIFEGKVVGYRIQATTGTEFDIAVEDTQLVTEDFKLIQGSGVPLELEARGGKLYPKDSSIRDVEELTYASIVSENGYSRLAETDVELKLMYNKFNRLYFDSKLPFDVPVYWSNKMTSCAGKCYRFQPRSSRGTNNNYTFKIGISAPYNTRFPHELDSIIIHEMIHVKYPGKHHSYPFKYEMERLNKLYNLGVTLKSSGSAVVNFFYECVRCGKIYERRSRLKNLSKYHCSCKGKLVEDAVDDWA